MSKTLAIIPKGMKVRVLRIQESPLKPKFMEMGILEGRELSILFKAPFGDPIAIDIHGYTLSLRLDEAKLISVEEIVEA